MSNSPAAHFECPECAKKYRWKQEIAGRRIKCACNAIVTVPMQDPSAAAAMVIPEQAPFGADMEPTRNCPQCSAPVKATAAICIACGTNLVTGAKLETTIAKPVQKGGGGGGARHTTYGGARDGFFARLRRSWEFAKISYGILWDFKKLLVLPLLSGLVTLVVLASFLLPLWGMGTMDQFVDAMDSEGRSSGSSGQIPPMMYVLGFLFYFISFFVIIFFNTALTACAMKVCNGEVPTLKYGFAVAGKRLPQIAGWAVFSALVGVLLKIIENANEKVGRWIAAIIGSAWTVLTFFVVPILCVEGVGPVEAVKKSATTLSETWGDTVLGNFSLGLFGFIVALPVYVVLFILLNMASSSGSQALTMIVLGLLVLTIIINAIASSAADVVLKALLYNYATGASIPADIDDSTFNAAFASNAE